MAQYPNCLPGSRPCNFSDQDFTPVYQARIELAGPFSTRPALLTTRNIKFSVTLTLFKNILRFLTRFTAPFTPFRVYPPTYWVHFPPNSDRWVCVILIFLLFIFQFLIFITFKLLLVLYLYHLYCISHINVYLCIV